MTYNCPLMSLTPSEKKLYQLYMSATPMFSWNATVHVEWNVRTLKLINLQCPHVPLYMYFGIPRKQVLHSRIDTAFSEGVRDMREQL